MGRPLPLELPSILPAKRDAIALDIACTRIAPLAHLWPESFFVWLKHGIEDGLCKQMFLAIADKRTGDVHLS